MSTDKIPPPRPHRPPLKVNIFEAMQAGNCQLMPLFPYLDQGSMVPAGAIFTGEGRDYGHFFHQNTVDEVALVFGSGGAAAEAGQVYVTSRLHGVRGPVKEPDGFAILAITQRQRAGQPQAEGIIFRCKQCNEIVFRHDYDATPPEQDGQLPFLQTLRGSAVAAERFNADRANRTCNKCGHVNEPFPGDNWGWADHVRQNWAASQALQSLRSAQERLATVEA